MIRVKVTKEDTTNMELDFDQPAVTLGRGTDRDIQLPSSKVSKHHATLHLQAGVVTIVDEGSTNGTYLGPDRIDGPHLLTADEEVYIGDFVISVQSLDEPGPTQVLDLSGPAATAKPSAPRRPQVVVNPWPSDE